MDYGQRGVDLDFQCQQYGSVARRHDCFGAGPRRLKADGQIGHPVDVRGERERASYDHGGHDTLSAFQNKNQTDARPDSRMARWHRLLFGVDLDGSCSGLLISGEHEGVTGVNLPRFRRHLMSQETARDRKSVV